MLYFLQYIVGYDWTYYETILQERLRCWWCWQYVSIQDSHYKLINKQYPDHLLLTFYTVINVNKNFAQVYASRMSLAKMKTKKAHGQLYSLVHLWSQMIALMLAMQDVRTWLETMMIEHTISSTDEIKS